MVAAIGRTKTITKKGEFELAAADKSLLGQVIEVLVAKIP